jgi:hypothetical protein
VQAAEHFQDPVLTQYRNNLAQQLCGVGYTIATAGPPLHSMCAGLCEPRLEPRLARLAHADGAGVDSMHFKAVAHGSDRSCLLILFGGNCQLYEHSRFGSSSLRSLRKPSHSLAQARDRDLSLCGL